MVTREHVLAALERVADPELGRSLVELGMVKSVQVSGGKVIIEISLTIAGCPRKSQIRDDVVEAVERIPGVSTVEVVLGQMSPQERERLVASLRESQTQDESPFGPESKTRVIAVASGKGGVGKSTVTANLAVALVSKGYDVGVLDADIHGFSIPRILGAAGEPTLLDGTILPLLAHGVKFISMGSFVGDNTPVIWRGPLLMKALKQLVNDVFWGDLDYLLVDMPPGTGDIAISLYQMIPQSKLILVTTPQSVAASVASRVGQMAAKTGQEIIGVVENMSYFVCPGCGTTHQVFGAGGGEDLARRLEVPLLEKIPLEAETREKADRGQPVAFADTPGGEAFRRLATRISALEPALAGAQQISPAPS